MTDAAYDARQECEFEIRFDNLGSSLNRFMNFPSLENLRSFEEDCWSLNFVSHGRYDSGKKIIAKAFELAEPIYHMLEIGD